jgi:hypothetical protein
VTKGRTASAMVLVGGKIDPKRVSGLFNCKKQYDLNAMAIKTNSLPNSNEELHTC